MQDGQVQLRARLNEFYDDKGISIYARLKRQNANWRPEGELKFVEAEQGLPNQPFLYLDKAEAQLLMDDLWLCGLRPSEGAGSAGAMKKVENHLADMRKIVSKKLGMEL